MDQKTETRADRIRDRFDDLADSVLLTETETAAVLGYSPATLKWWRAKRTGRGPQEIYVLGAVRYSVAAIRKWRADQVKRGDKGKRPRPPVAKAVALPVKTKARKAAAR